MHYRSAAEQNTPDTQEQIKAKEEEVITANFTSGEYASLCRGDTSKVPVLSLFYLRLLANFEYPRQSPTVSLKYI